MKNKLSKIIGGTLLLLFTSFNVWAKDMTPKMNNVLAESTLINATEITLKPGEKTNMHTHPYYFFYALTQGKLKVHYQDGKDETFDLKPGESGVSEPERPHITENVGKSVVKFLTVELKEHPYKATKMMKK
jgi:mannose-6-phosphate isomerase-like protein (cupin superfamily)